MTKHEAELKNYMLMGCASCQQPRDKQTCKCSQYECPFQHISNMLQFNYILNGALTCIFVYNIFSPKNIVTEKVRNYVKKNYNRWFMVNTYDEYNPIPFDKLNKIFIKEIMLDLE